MAASGVFSYRNGVNDVKQANMTYDDADSVLLSDNVNVVEVSDDVTLTSESHSELSNEQMADTTLATCWKMAKEGKGGFVILNDVLHHKDKVEGQPCHSCVTVVSTTE